MDVEFEFSVQIKRETHKGEVPFHSTDESLAILPRRYNGRFSPSPKECGLFHPTFEFFIPRICTDVIYSIMRIMRLKVVI